MSGDLVGGPTHSLANLGIAGFVVRVLSGVPFGSRRRPFQHLLEFLDFLLDRVDLNSRIGVLLVLAALSSRTSCSILDRKPDRRTALGFYRILPRICGPGRSPASVRPLPPSRGPIIEMDSLWLCY